MLEKRVLCLYQFIKMGNFNLPGVGNCKICTTDEKNKECLKYRPISVIYMDVQDGYKKDTGRYMQ
jgi:hypothetical protein